MKKVIWGLLLVTIMVTLLFCTVTITYAASSGICGDNLTWSLDDSGTLTISGSGAMKSYSYNSSPWYSSRSSVKKIVIGENVTSIGNYAFYDCDGFTNVTIPDSVTSIGSDAFSNCSSLKSVTIGENVTRIGDHAFWECSSLTRVDIYDMAAWCNISFGNYYANPLYYAKNLYLNNAKVTDLVIPEGVTSIGDFAFYDCDGLTSVTIPDSVTSIGDFAFYDCDGLTSVTIPDSVTSIGYSAFEYCSSLKSVTIPDSVTSIGNSAFSDCYNLTSVTIPDSVTSIGYGAFSDCYKLTSVTIPNGVESIGGSAFRNCDGLTSITIGENVTSIGRRAFYDCDGLTSVTIGKNVTSIGNDAFAGCSKISEVKYGGLPSEWEHILMGTGNTSLTGAKINYFSTVTVLDENDKVVTSSEINRGQYFDGSGIPAIVGYSFALYTDKECTQVFDYNTTPVNENITLYLAYSIGQYTYKFVNEDGTVLKEETVDYGSLIELPPTPEDTGIYTFDKWAGYEENMTVTGDVVFVAVYKYKSFRISVEGFELTLDVPYGENYILTPAEKYGYEFVGYHTEADGQGVKLADSEGKSVAAYTFETDITVYPHFKDLLVNKAVFTGDSSVVVGQSNIRYTLTVGTDKANIKYATICVKYPNDFGISKFEKKAIVEEIIQSGSKSDEEYTITELLVVCPDNLAIPIFTPTELFDIYFDVSTKASLGDVTISMTENSVIMDDMADYPFAELFPATVTIEPKIAESIVIEGPDSIDGATGYQAVVMPDYTTDKSVIWQVDDEAVAIISEDGILTPVKSGTVTVKATSVSNPEVFVFKNVAVTAYAKIVSLTTDGIWSEEFNDNVKSYTIYVDEDTQQFNITPVSGSGGRFDIGGTTVISNRTITVPLTENVSEIVVTLHKATGYTDNTYTLKVVKTNKALIPEVRASEENAFEFNVIINKNKIEAFETAKLVVALYDEDGKLLGFGLADVSSSDVTQTVQAEAEGVPVTAKVMLWDLENVKPFAEDAILQLNSATVNL